MLIKNARHAAAVLALVIFAIPAAQAQATTTQDVAYAVQRIQLIALSGTPSLTITTAASAGSAPTSVTAVASYAITTNMSDSKITASLSVKDMPSGLTLSASLVAPSGAAGGVKHALTFTGGAVDMVTGVTGVNAPALAITYTLDATSAAVVQSSTATVIYTVTLGT